MSAPCDDMQRRCHKTLSLAGPPLSMAGKTHRAYRGREPSSGLRQTRHSADSDLLDTTPAAEGLLLSACTFCLMHVAAGAAAHAAQ